MNQNQEARLIYSIFKVFSDGKYERCTHSPITLKIEELSGLNVDTAIEELVEIAVKNHGDKAGYYCIDNYEQTGVIFPGHNWQEFLIFLKDLDSKNIQKLLKRF